jgi:hypothetical protein
MRQAHLVGLLAGGLLLAAGPAALAQQRMGSTGTTAGSFGSASSGGSFTGGSTFGSSGSTAGSFGSTSSGGGFTGGVSFGGGGTGGAGGFGGGGFGGGGGGVGTTQVGSTSPFGRYYGNPLAAGVATSGTGVSASQASKYYRAFPTTLSFGTPIYGTTGTAGVTRTGVGGTTGLGTFGAGGTLSASITTFAGASSAGIRRAPAYITEPVFDVPRRPRGEAIRGDLQAIIDRSSRLPSRSRIRVVTDGEVIILRGQVRDQRERRLAEAVIRLTPGVREVRNELKPTTLSPPRNEPPRR